MAAAMTRSVRVVRLAVEASLGLLFVQLPLGMWVNLFAGFPDRTNGVNPVDLIFSRGPASLALHFAVGFALGVLALAGLVAAVASRDARLVALEAAALGFVLLAGESGIEFVLGWYSEDVYSFTMTLGFVFLLALYSLTSRRVRVWYPGTPAQR